MKNKTIFLLWLGFLILLLTDLSTGELIVKARDEKAQLEGVDSNAKVVRLTGKQGVEIRGVKDESHQRSDS